jgi:hypothetical protein
VDETYADSLTDAIEFTVVEGDFFGTGRIFPAVVGVCLVDGHWHLEALGSEHGEATSYDESR